MKDRYEFDPCGGGSIVPSTPVAARQDELPDSRHPVQPKTPNLHQRNFEKKASHPAFATPGTALVAHPSLNDILSLTPSLANPPPAPTQLLAAAAAVATVPTVLPAQPGLIVAPPPPAMRILPFAEQKHAISPSQSNAKWYAIPMARLCTVMQPILSTDPSVWQTYGEGCENKGFGRTFTRAQGGYPAALAHVLAHFSQKPLLHPKGICLNCFLIHPGTPCASPMYDWNLHIRNTSHPACPSCGQQHFIGLPCPSDPSPSSQ